MSKPDINKAAKDGATTMHIESKDAVDKADKNGDTPLHIAVKWGEKNTVKQLIESKANLNKANKHGETPLFSASLSGSLSKYRKIAKMLLDSKAAVDAANKRGDAPLHYSAFFGYTEMVKMLLDYKANVDTPNDRGETPLFSASGNALNPAFNKNKAKIVKMLLDSKAAVDKAQKDQFTPLIYAAMEGRFPVVKLLVEAGADTTIREKITGEERYTAAQYAREKGHNDIADYLNKEAPRVQRFLPSRNEGIEGGAIRALKRDLLSTGLLPVGPLVIIQEFAIGEPGELAPWSLFRN